MGQSSDDILRYPWDSPDAVVSVEYWRHHGAVLPVPVLASVLLCVHQKTEERGLQAGAKYPEHYSTVGVSRHFNSGPLCF
jgi:hypothetical protein